MRFCAFSVCRFKISKKTMRFRIYVEFKQSTSALVLRFCVDQLLHNIMVNQVLFLYNLFQNNEYDSYYVVNS